MPATAAPPATPTHDTRSSYAVYCKTHSLSMSQYVTSPFRNMSQGVCRRIRSCLNKCLQSRTALSFVGDAYFCITLSDGCRVLSSSGEVVRANRAVALLRRQQSRSEWVCMRSKQLRPLLRSSALQLTDADLEEDRVYSVLSKIDKDASGFVCKDEFMRAVTRALKFREIVNQGADSGDSPDVSPLGLRHGSKSEKRRCRNKMLRKELAKWDETDIAHCWAATQGAVRALAATSGCASSVFQVLDSDGDGAIDRQEFQEGIKQLLRGSSLLKSIERWEPLLWKLVDDDGSGYVSPSELNMAFSVYASCLEVLLTMFGDEHEFYQAVRKKSDELKAELDRPNIRTGGGLLVRGF
eukprot:s247_g8.t1